jgi:hypothetical protein
MARIMLLTNAVAFEDPMACSTPLDAVYLELLQQHNTFETWLGQCRRQQALATLSALVFGKRARRPEGSSLRSGAGSLVVAEAKHQLPEQLFQMSNMRVMGAPAACWRPLQGLV